MSDKSNEKVVIKIFSEIFNDQNILILSSTKIDDLDLDSLDTLDIMQRIRNETGYDFNVDDFAKCENLGQIISHIK
jgi:acyl carrier protein